MSSYYTNFIKLNKKEFLNSKIEVKKRCRDARTARFYASLSAPLYSHSVEFFDTPTPRSIFAQPGTRGTTSLDLPRPYVNAVERRRRHRCRRRRRRRRRREEGTRVLFFTNL